MPTRELMPYIAMAPRVAAQRAITQAEQVAVGTGRLKESAHREVVARWRRDVTAGSVRERPTAEQLASMARAAGVGFRTVRTAAPG